MTLASPQKKINYRSRAAQKAFRKQQLIDATIDCINRLGIAQTTLARITERAGVSQGIVIFHFNSKQALFEQTLDHLSREYRAVWRSAFEKAGNGAADKLCSIVQSRFDPKVCSKKIIGVWYAFWGEAHSRPKVQAACGEIDREFSTAVLDLCREICAGGDTAVSAEIATLGIEGMIDGLWQNCLLEPDIFNRKQACRTVFELMEAIFPDEKEIIQHYQSAQV